MTIATRILVLLKEAPNGLDDDEIARALKLSARQQANSRCRAMEKEGLVRRERIDGKIRNFWTGKEPAIRSSQIESGRRSSKPWYWEGNVQEQIVEFLRSDGYTIQSAADTASRTPGIDIVADLGGQALWVTVKGFPEGTAKTHPSTQAGHWFKQAVFDVVDYRGRSSDVSLAMGLPDFPRYRSLAQKIQWLQPVARFQYLWVNERDVRPETT